MLAAELNPCAASWRSGFFSGNQKYFCDFDLVIFHQHFRTDRFSRVFGSKQLRLKFTCSAFRGQWKVTTLRFQEAQRGFGGAEKSSQNALVFSAAPPELRPHCGGRTFCPDLRISLTKTALPHIQRILDQGHVPKGLLEHGP